MAAEAAPAPERTERPDRGPRPEGGKRNDRGDRGGKPNHKGGDKKPYDKPRDRSEGTKTFEARPPRVEKPIDPDNPFAVLAALKSKL